MFEPMGRKVSWRCRHHCDGGTIAARRPCSASSSLRWWGGRL